MSGDIFHYAPSSCGIMLSFREQPEGRDDSWPFLCFLVQVKTTDILLVVQTRSNLVRWTVVPMQSMGYCN